MKKWVLLLLVSGVCFGAQAQMTFKVTDVGFDVHVARLTKAIEERDNRLIWSVKEDNGRGTMNYSSDPLLCPDAAVSCSYSESPTLANDNSITRTYSINYMDDETDAKKARTTFEELIAKTSEGLGPHYVPDFEVKTHPKDSVESGTAWFHVKSHSDYWDAFGIEANVNTSVYLELDYTPAYFEPAVWDIRVTVTTFVKK